MADLAFLRQAPLDPLGLAARATLGLGQAGLGLGEIRFRGAVNLRARRDDPAARQALAGALGLNWLQDTGETVQAGELALLALGPDEWLAVGGNGPAVAERLYAATVGRFVAVTDVSENWTTLMVTGREARTVLAKGCPLDLHPKVFAVGRCAGSLMAKSTVVLRLVEETSTGPRFELLVRRSFAEYLFRWLEDAGREYSVAVLTV